MTLICDPVHSNDHPPPHIHVEMPPGTPFTRLEWPTLRLLRGDRALSKRQRKDLDSYVSEYGAEIDQEIRQVFR